MNLTKQDEETIYNIGYLGMGLPEIIHNFNFDKDSIIQEFESESGHIYETWFKGWFTAQVELNKVIMDSAKNSSSPALFQMFQLRKKTEKKTNKLINE